MKLVVISSPNSPNTIDLLKSAERLGVQGSQVALKDLTFSIDKLLVHPFFQYDVYIFRGYTRNFVLALSLARYLNHLGKIVIDDQLTRSVVFSKFHEALIYTAANIAHIPTYSSENFSAFLKTDFNGEYPVVVKDVSSQKGKGVRLCYDELSLRDEIDQHGHTVIIQKYMPIAYDLRIICVGDKVLGAIKREAVAGEFRTNVSLGGTASIYTLNEAEQKLALRAHRALGYDVSGVDIAHFSNGAPFVIETNISPEWQGFKEATGIDVASAIINYAVEKYER